MTRPKADSTDDLLTHIRRGPGRDPDRYVRDFERLHRDSPTVECDRPSDPKR